MRASLLAKATATMLGCVPAVSCPQPFFGCSKEGCICLKKLVGPSRRFSNFPVFSAYRGLKSACLWLASEEPIFDIYSSPESSLLGAEIGDKEESRLHHGDTPACSCSTSARASVCGPRMKT